MSNRKTDSVKIDGEDLSSCPTCLVIIKDRTDQLQIRPLFIQLVTPGLDLYHNSFFGYRAGQLREFFALDDTEEKGIELQKVDLSTLTGYVFGIDEIVGAMEHNYPVSINLKSFEVSHTLPAKQFIGFRTAATKDIRAYQVIDGFVSNRLREIKAGDSLTIDTFYRASGKVRLKAGDSVTVEIKLETAKKKLWRPPAAG